MTPNVRSAVRVLTHALAALGLSLALCACGDDASAGADGGGQRDDQFGNAGTGGGHAGTRAGAGGSGSGSGGSGVDAGGESGSGADASAGAGGETQADASAPDAGSPAQDAGTSDAGGTPGGPIGTVQLGRLCANDGNCSQDMGAAVCCANSCELLADCPESPGYLPCTVGEDCAAFGGGKICCELGNARFCTKRSACNGDEIP
jgi:hypothetical protein